MSEISVLNLMHIDCFLKSTGSGGNRLEFGVGDFYFYFCSLDRFLTVCHGMLEFGEHTVIAHEEAEGPGDEVSRILASFFVALSFSQP